MKYDIRILPLSGTGLSTVNGNIRHTRNTVPVYCIYTQNGKARIGLPTHRPTGSSFQNTSRTSHGLPWMLVRLTMGSSLQSSVSSDISALLQSMLPFAFSIYISKLLRAMGIALNLLLTAIDHSGNLRGFRSTELQELIHVTEYPPEGLE